MGAGHLEERLGDRWRGVALTDAGQAVLVGDPYDECVHGAVTLTARVAGYGDRQQFDFGDVGHGLVLFVKSRGRQFDACVSYIGTPAL